MTNQDLTAQAEQNAQALVDLLELAGIACEKRPGCLSKRHIVTVCSLDDTGLFADVHECGNPIVWFHGVPQPYPDLIEVAMAFKQLLAGGER